LFFAASLFLFSAEAGQAETIWTKDNDFVRLERADGASAASTLPRLSADAIRASLSAVRVTHDSETVPVLDEDQLAIIAEPISRALAEASPGQDVVFSVHGRWGTMDYFGPPRSTAGRIFVDGGSLDLIIGQVKGTFLASGLTIDPSRIRTGSRLTAQDTEHRIVPNGAVSLAIAGRSDWARISPQAWIGTSYSGPMAQAPAAAPAYAAAPAASAAPMPEPASPAMVAAPVPQDPNQIEQRFLALKRLLDNHMISQDDYDHAKADLLKAMASLPPQH
jgi:hypothetical protein